MACTIYCVAPLCGDWDVRRVGRVLSHHCRKREAIAAAARLASADRPSVVQIQRRDGSIESRRMYRACGRSG